MGHSLELRHLAYSCLLLCCILSVILATPSIHLHAQATVSIRVQVIQAANEPGGVDARLGNLAAELQRLPYSMYRLLEVPQGTAALNQTWRTGIPGGRALEITPTAIQAGQYSLKVRVLGPGGPALVNTEVRLRSGSPFLVAVPTSQKDALIIAITAG